MIQTIITIAVALISSSGVWGLFNLAIQKKNDTTRLMIGVAQHLIVRESHRLLEQGHMTTDDYRNIRKGLYEPYKQLGGNGLAEKMVNDVEKLPINQRRYDV
jgi:hypothetical protein